MNEYRDLINRVIGRTAAETQTCTNSETGDCEDCGLCVERHPQAIQTIIDSGADRIGATLGLTGALKQEIARMIDHTVLKPDATEEMISVLCDEAMKYCFASVCVNPCWIRMCRTRITDPAVKVCGVAGFPLGSNLTTVKAVETSLMAEDGADEIDMVMNVGWAKSGQWNQVEKDIAEVVRASGDAHVKVIIEACFLTDEEKVKACLCSVNAGADYVKTSTGFGKWGAKAADVALMRRVVGPHIGVKAAGGIRDFSDALEMVGKGADRIGASAGIKIVGV
ncbi:MAG: deoxyribose-phosphate aldolase [FCB group bacterium]|nr:deoxyribose-phosphate aldolase [FCB group bacterium]